MGCTNENVTFICKTKKEIHQMIDLFNDILKDELYYGKYDLEDSEIEETEDGFSLNFEEMPLLCGYEEGTQIEDFAVEYAKKYPDKDFTIYYLCTFSNCGDALDIEIIYSAKDKKISIRKLYGEYAGIEFCSECEETFDETLVYLENYDPNETYICPYCGAKLTLDVSKITKEIQL